MSQGVRPPAEFVEAMIKVIRYRFEAFQRAFGRNPKPNEPLFFVEGLPFPTLAEWDRVAEQLSEAALVTGVEVRELMKWLNFC